MAQLSLLTPLGDITVSEDEGAIVSLDWGRVEDQTPTPLLLRARDQLNDYFDGGTQGFDLPLNPYGTPFQRRVWAALSDIPYGARRSYADLARLLGSGPRAIGGANGRNPIPIIIPCHRCVAADGSLGGYSGLDGPATKQFLLDLETRDLLT